MPDLISLPRTRYGGIQEFRMLYALDSGFRRNDKSLRDKERLSSPKGEGFPPSPIGTLITGIAIFRTTGMPVDYSFI
jgi:hypothetical protein